MAPSKPQPNADWMETWTRFCAFMAAWAMAMICPVASSVLLPVFLRLWVSLAETPMQNRSTPQAMPRSSPFSFKTRPEKISPGRFFAVLGKVQEQLVGVGHLRNFFRVDERTELDHVDAGGQQTLQPFDLFLKRDGPLLDLQAIPQTHFMNSYIGHISFSSDMLRRN